LVMSVIASVLGVSAPEMVVVGDDVKLEIRMARDAGATSVLVLTGSSQRADADSVAESLKPHVVVESLAELLAGLCIGAVLGIVCTRKPTLGKKSSLKRSRLCREADAVAQRSVLGIVCREADAVVKRSVLGIVCVRKPILKKILLSREADAVEKRTLKRKQTL